MSLKLPFKNTKFFASKFLKTIKENVREDVKRSELPIKSQFNPIYIDSGVSAQKFKFATFHYVRLETQSWFYFLPNSYENSYSFATVIPQYYSTFVLN